jgi:H+/Cl- antiporter ClcA
MELGEIYKNIDWKSLVFGTAFFSFITIVATGYKIDILLAASSLGLLYIGFKAQNSLQACILGAIATIPLFIIGQFNKSLGLSTEGLLTMWIFLGFLITGIFCGFVGAYLNKSRKRSHTQKIPMDKSRKKKKINKK